MDSNDQFAFLSQRRPMNVLTSEGSETVWVWVVTFLVDHTCLGVGMTQEEAQDRACFEVYRKYGGEGGKDGFHGVGARLE